MLAKGLLVLAATVVSAASRPSEDAIPKRGILLFHCIGAMRVAGVPAMPIVADAFIDLAAKRVDGFGVRSAPIVSASEVAIAFGNPVGAAGDRVQGWLDRQTGKARIVVLAANEPARELIAMELDCRPLPSIS